MKRLAVLAVSFVMLVAGAVTVPAAIASTPVQAAAGPQQVLAFANVFGALFQRNRVYRNAADVQNELRAYYDGLLETARARLRSRELALTGSQLAAYRRMVESLQAERNATLQLLEDDKRGARQTFRTTLHSNLATLLLSLPSARQAAELLRTNLGDIRDVLQNVRAVVESGRPPAIADIARIRGQLDQYAAVVGLLGGKPGRDLANAIGTIGDQLQQIETAAGDATGGLEQGIGEVDAQVGSALGTLDEQLSQEVRPTSVSVFGGLHEVRLPAQAAFYAAVAQALGQLGSVKYGMTRDAMRDRVHQYLIASHGALLTGITTCFRAQAAQIRAQLAGAAGPDGAAAQWLTADLSTCDPDVVAAVLAAAAEFEATSEDVSTTEPTESTETTEGSSGDLAAACLANDSIEVTAVQTGSDTGGYAEGYSGEVTITNVSSDPVYVRYRLVQNYSTPVTDTWTWARLWEPGESWTEQIDASFNNAHSGEQYWYLITDVMAFVDEPACFELFAGDDTAVLDAVAVDVPNPLPFGP